MKWNPKFLAIMAIAAISAMTISAKMQKATNTGVTIGKEADVTYSLVVTDASVAEAGQIGQLDAWNLELIAPVDTELTANTFATVQIQKNAAFAPTTANLSSAEPGVITDQLAYKIAVAADEVAFTTTGAAQLGSS